LPVSPSPCPHPACVPSPAMQQVLDNLMGLPGSPGVADLDLIFLRGIMESPIVRSLAKAHERLEERKLEAVRGDNLALVQDILRDIGRLARPEAQAAAAELARILREPHFQSLLETHDSVAAKSYEPPPSSPGPEASLGSQPVPPDAVRMVGIRKAAGENLGVTFRVERGELVIARILHGGMVAQQGLLHVGDVIREVNGREVGSDPRALQDSLRHASGSVVLKILPSYQEPHPPRQGVPGNCEGPWNWGCPRSWGVPCGLGGFSAAPGMSPRVALCPQACHVEGGSAGLVPSQLLEEKRKAFVKRDGEVTPSSGALCGSLSGKRKKRMMYLTTKNAEFDRHELLIYEEVARMPPFRRKTLVLIGAQGVGRRSLKNKLIMSDQARYGTTIPYTSRKPKESERDGQGYRFVSRGEMEADIKAGRYLEHGEYEGNLYGTRIDSIRAVVEAGKMCILDVNPQAVKVLRTAEFVPYVVFIEAPGPERLRAMNRAALESGVATKQLTEADAQRTVEESSRIQRGYGHYFDLSLTNDDLERTFGRLREAMEHLRVQPQWVPVTWVY
ncbi:MPP2 protein, partial [Alaudala cheleensis]|nr:MPP2 protein [Alaudala cheleensis]